MMKFQLDFNVWPWKERNGLKKYKIYSIYGISNNFSMCQQIAARRPGYVINVSIFASIYDIIHSPLSTIPLSIM